MLLIDINIYYRYYRTNNNVFSILASYYRMFLFCGREKKNDQPINILSSRGHIVVASHLELVSFCNTFSHYCQQRCAVG